ncbi:MAG: M6 family metalloprotease domain-containing protein, partial [Muribaculaceae bacterium]|nr:M6 family metalloprotease domain-containing protein [Muribaculaceae bacterium]
MKKITLLLLAIALAFVASAEPANPKPITIAQPNGEKLQLKLVGDEFYHFNTTIDGYTILNVKGTWEYAMKNGEQLVSTGVMAHDPEMRSASEQQLLETTAKFLVDKQQTNNALKARQTRDNRNQQKEPAVDYSLFRGLIILINFNDKQFQMDDPNEFYNQLCNTENYTGFYHQGRFQRCTGSVRDYYYDNSMGQFDPVFDIVGPVDLNYSCYEGNDKAREIFKAALDSVDEQVDFTQYDADNDGEIDMVFFMVAGYSSSYSGNNSGYLWPHMSYLIDWWSGWPPQPYIYDGKRMGTYASSCEIYGWEDYGYNMPNAIGTFCHEFGHVLGLPDLYDTDYAEGGGQSNHPDEWDVMAGGSSNNYGRTPVGYSLWERWELGFADEPQALSLGSYTLSALDI